MVNSERYQLLHHCKNASVYSWLSSYRRLQGEECIYIFLYLKCTVLTFSEYTSSLLSHHHLWLKSDYVSHTEMSQTRSFSIRFMLSLPCRLTSSLFAGRYSDRRANQAHFLSKIMFFSGLKHCWKHVEKSECAKRQRQVRQFEDFFNAKILQIHISCWFVKCHQNSSWADWTTVIWENLLAVTADGTVRKLLNSSQI